MQVLQKEDTRLIPKSAQNQLWTPYTYYGHLYCIVVTYVTCHVCDCLSCSNHE